MTFNGPIGGLIEFAIGGGWGSDVPKENHSRVAVIRGTDIPKVASGDFSSVPFRYESDKKLLNRILAPGDVVLETAGGSSANGQYTGRTLLITQEILDVLGPTICASFCKKLVLNKELVSPSYFYLYMQDLYKSGRVASYDSQSTGISNFQYEAFVNNEILELPKLENQTSVASALMNLQSKINNNSLISNTLEEIAQTIFKSWFIDFDPVKAKMAGEKPVGMDAATAALFPDSMEESEAGLIPKGWKVKVLGDLVIPRKGKTITKASCVYGDVPVVAGGLQPAYFHNKANVSQPVVTVSASGANAGFVRLYLQDIWASDCSYISYELTQTVYFWYLFLSINQERIYGMQQGAAQPHIYPSDLMRLKLIYPDSLDFVIKFEETVTPIFLQIGALEKQNDSLRILRDSLLPRLISGQLQIPEEMLVS
jgi:type I restriction enzyme S subunit